MARDSATHTFCCGNRIAVRSEDPVCRSTPTESSCSTSASPSPGTGVPLSSWCRLTSGSLYRKRCSGCRNPAFMNRSPRRRTTFPRAEPMTRRRSGKHLAFLRRHERVSRRLGGRCAACARYQAPVAEPLVAFGCLVDDPRRRCKPLQREVEGRWAARAGRLPHPLPQWGHQNDVRAQDLPSSARVSRRLTALRSSSDTFVVVQLPRVCVRR